MPRTQNRLSDRALRNLKPGAAKPYDLADGGDLYVRVETSGTIVFWLRYQREGKRRRWVLGHYGNGESGLSLAEARERRDAARKLLREGIDPWDDARTRRLEQERDEAARAEREREQTRKRTETVSWLVDQFCTLELPAMHKKPAWGTQLLRTHVEKPLGALALSELTTAKVWTCLDPLRAQQPATARHVYGLLRKLTAYGVRRGYLQSDPALSIERKTVAPKPPPRQRVLSDDEIRAL